MNEDKDKDKYTDTTSLGSGESYFYYGQVMQKNWIETNAVLMKYISSKFGQSTKASLMTGTLVVTEVYSNELTKFKTKDEQIEHIEKLEFWEQEEFQNTKDNYQKFSRITRKNLTEAHLLLESIYHVRLKNRSEVEPEYYVMVAGNPLNAMMMRDLIKKICNSYAHVEVDDVSGNAVENMCYLLLLRGDNYPPLPKS